MTTSEAIQYFEVKKMLLASINLKGLMAHNMAIKALKAQLERENPQPLDLKELKKMDTPAYFVPLRYKNCTRSNWCIVSDDGEEVLIMGEENAWWDIKDYGETWLAYRHKPKEADHGT